MALVVGPERATPWTKPDELVMDPDVPLACLGEISGSYIATNTVDGRVLMIPANIEPSNFLALATPAGKEVIDGDSYRQEFNDSLWIMIPNLLRNLTRE